MKLPKKSGFTLIELLVVIAIIAILAGLILPAVIKAKQRAKRTKAIAEIKNIEIAWNNYYSQYKRWPNLMPDVMPPELESSGTAIDAKVARILEGENDPNKNNPGRLRLMQFNRRDAEGAPINPWGDPQGHDPKYRYYIKFDINRDGVIAKGAGEPDDPPDRPVQRKVIVWTINPDVPVGNKYHLLGSWKY